jgi:TRAP-type mannitol/chloroaromatic compound transport system substrate-binding protein
MLGDGMRRLIDQVGRASGGSLLIHLHEPGALIPAAETVDGVSEGRIVAAWAGAGWFAGRDSAFNMFSTVPFGPSVSEYLAWMYHGGGLQLARELFHQHGVHNIPCAIIPPEASGWFKREIRTLDDLKGLRMRFFGLGARVMEKLGVTTRQLPPGDISRAFEADEIDAAEFSLPSMDLPLGLHRYTSYLYFPGWHQQATLFDLYVNHDRWLALSEQHRTIIELACSDTMRELIARAEAEQWQALREIQAQGTQLRRWPPEILVAFEDAWIEVAAEEVHRNPSFARVYRSYEAFRSNYAIWRRMNFLQ